MKRRLAIAVLVVVASAGCARTRYLHLAPPTGTSVESRDLATDAQTTRNGWQHFFFYGLLPGKRVYPLDVMCGAAENVVEVATRQTFLQGLVTMFAGYYVNVYAPYQAQVTCLEPPPATLPTTPDELPSEAPEGVPPVPPSEMPQTVAPEAEPPSLPPESVDAADGSGEESTLPWDSDPAGP